MAKVTAGGREFPQACRRMDRCLREFRIRGVKTNIPFLVNVVNHERFQAGGVTTSFLAETPELFRFAPLKDRATRLLRYLGEVIVNGNPEVADKPRPQSIRPPPLTALIPEDPQSGTRHLLYTLGPEKFRWCAKEGIDIFRGFDALNWVPNMKLSVETIRNKTDKVWEAAICYTGDILDPKRDKYPLQYYIRLAKELEKMGAHILCIKDMGGLCKPYAAARLFSVLRDEVALPIHFHTHDTSGINAASILKAAEAGVHAADAAIASMSGTTSQPNLNSVVAALQHTERDTGLDLEALNACADYWEKVRTWYRPSHNPPPSGTAEVYIHEMPGGQYTNFREQTESLGLGARWQEIARAYAEVNFAFGDIVKVTPSSNVVGDMAIFLVSHDMSVKDL